MKPGFCALSKNGYTEEELRMETESSSQFEKITFNIKSFECSSCTKNHRSGNVYNAYINGDTYHWISSIEVHSPTEHPYISIDKEEGSFLFHTEGLYLIIWKSIHHQLYLENIRIAEEQQAIKWIEVNQKIRFKTSFNHKGYGAQFSVIRMR